MRIRHYKSMAGKMLAAGGHAGIFHAQHHGLAQLKHGVGIGMERAVADDRRGAVIEVEHRPKTEVDPVRAQLTRQYKPGFTCKLTCALRVRIPDFAKRSHRRNAGEAFAKPLHASAFVIDSDQQRRRFKCVDLGSQRGQLRRIAVIAGEQNHAAHQGMGQALAVLIREFGACNIEHQRAQRHGLSFMECGVMMIFPPGYGVGRIVPAPHTPAQGPPRPTGKHDARGCRV